MKRQSIRLLTAVAALLAANNAKADSPVEPALVINEIMTANIDMFLDPSLNYGSWIELFNPTDADINISGWYLSDDPADLQQFPLGSRKRIVPAHGFLNLWMGHVDDYCLDQLDFSLRNEGGSITLSDTEGNPVSEVWYPQSLPRISWARTEDGGEDWSYTGYPTPETTNATSLFASEQLDPPVVDTDSHLFSTKFSINIEIPEGAVLYYTLNGTTPTPDNPSSKICEGTHTVLSTKVIRFRLYRDGYLPSQVVTRSYIKTTNDYKIPVVSIVTANDNLYSTEYGLWAKGPNGKSGNGQDDLCNWNREWDRPVNVEIIDEQGRMIINQEAELCPSGRYSRAYDPRPFKLEAKKKFGYETFFPFTPFQDKPYNKYKALKMRNGGNKNQTRFQDAALHEIILRSGLNLDCQSYQPVHHYINGVYKGVINLREPNNKDYAFANYGYDEDELDFFKVDHRLGNGGYAQVKGSSDAWDEWFTLAKNASNPESYSRICELVDIEEFANYLAVEFFLYNWDWPRNNVKAFRHRTDGGRFRFIMFDLDYAFGFDNTPGSTNPFTFFDSEEYYSAADGGGYKTVMVTLIHNMLKNSTFRKIFIDSFTIVAGSVFEPERSKAIVDELAARAKQEMSFYNESPMSDANKINNAITSSYISGKITQLSGWSYAKLSNVKKARKTIYSNIPDARLTINDLPIPTGHFDGQLFMPATVKAQAPSGYKFEAWRDKEGFLVSRLPDYTVNNFTQTLVATFVPDSAQALLQHPLRINELSADNSLYMNDNYRKTDWIEIYNTTSEEVDAGGFLISDDTVIPDKYVIPEGSLIPAHGFLTVWCDDTDTDTARSTLHAPFKLKKSNGTVMLSAPDLSWSDTLSYGPHEGYQSIGLYPDGGNSSYVMNRPSLEKPNMLNTFDSIDRETVITTVKGITAEKRNDETIYNLFGQPVTVPQPGHIYIIGHRKVLY
ncbi:MAG: CotH kinase family protein [Bacteroidaceae bacterium]|nr:CotH kinase family protein [Bacteroidaceae bacterium]